MSIVNESLNDEQRQKLAGLKVWFATTAGRMLQWQQELTLLPDNLGKKNRQWMLTMMIKDVQQQLGDVDPDQWSDQPVKVWMIFPMALVRVSELTAGGTEQTLSEADMLCQAISDSLLSIDFLPPEITAELDRGHASMREELAKLLR